MAGNTVKTRIQLKNDTEVNWSKAVNFIPLKGEVIIYSADDTHPFSRLKVGNGKDFVNDLPFIDANTINGMSIQIGTTQEWQTKLNYIPKKDDIIIYTDKDSLEDGTIVPGIKIGDGLAYGIDLPFIGSDIEEKILNHIGNNVQHITEEERIRWNRKINCNDFVDDETLVLTRN